MNSTLVYAVCAVLVLAVIKDINPTFSLLGGMYVGIVLFASGIRSFSEFYQSISNEMPSEVTEAIVLIMKVTGISICTDVGADICGQLGYAAAGKGMVLCGRISVLIMSLPLVKELLSSVQVFT